MVVVQEQMTPEVAPPSSLTGPVVASVQNAGKSYLLFRQPQDRLKHALLWRFGKSYAREFWALRDVSFEVRRGEMLGVIGRNGSGKSTLLQLMAGTLAPTSGRVQVPGRVGALLELGSGFNPEFTGRENVFLNGAILGIPAAAMTRRFAEIEAFADIGDFIDQPVKTYSSGMFLRLAFAVTTSLECEVLLIDEALAVGDVFFRQKCYQRLRSLLQQGVAIVFVSHSMLDVEQYCQRALLLHRGHPVFMGTASEAVKRYYLIEQEERSPAQPGRPAPPSAALARPDFEHESITRPPAEAFFNLNGVSQVSNGWARCVGVALCDQQGRPRRAFEQGETARFFYEFEILQDIEVPVGGVVLQNDQGIIVHGKNTLQYQSAVPVQVSSGTRIQFQHAIKLQLAMGEYTFLVGLAAMLQADYERLARLSQAELEQKTVRLCHLPAVGQFVIGLTTTSVSRFSHHGVADLPGECQIRLVQD